MTPETWQKIKPILEQALALDASARPAFLKEACGSPSLLREAESLLEFETDESDRLDSSAFSVISETASPKSFIGKQIGKYKIVSELGSGGMGLVFLAERADGAFEQKVALKLIKSGIGSDSILRRFYAERQILASLDHPNIAHLIDGGTTDDELPYFVMEHVEGETVIEFARRRSLDVEARLDLFRKVCDGASYAHQNLVIHRDLKPSNILVNRDGIPKLLDFGIAKLLDAEGTGETATHQMAFTPDYASPEQLRGEALTTSTDIYSLGVILYELLSNRRPFYFENKNLGEIIRTSSQTEPPRPSAISDFKSQILNDATDRLNKRAVSKMRSDVSHTTLDSRLLRGDLDNIILKALHKDPSRRYSSVERLSEDIRRHLKGLPVFARRDTRWYRAEKFTRRNPLVVGAVAIAFLILIAGIIGVGWQARVANAERAKAERRFNDVRTLANSFIFEVNEKIKESPIQARELVVTRALEYLDTLAAEAEGDHDLQSELAAAYEKIGNVQSEIFSPSLGKTSAALSSHQKALNIRQKLLAAEPANTKRALDSIQSRMHVGNILSMSGRVAEAREEYQIAVTLGERLAADSPTDASIRRSLGRNYALLGQSILRSGSLNGALDRYNRSLEVYQALANDNRDDAGLRQAIGITSSYIGYVKLELGETAEAVKYFGDDLAASESAAAREPSSKSARSNLGIATLWLGIALSYQDPDKGIVHIRKALEIQRVIYEADKKNLGELNSLADCYLELGRALKKKALTVGGSRGDTMTEAKTSLETAVKNYEAVWQNDRENYSTLRQISFARIYLGDVVSMNGNRGDAVAIYEQALVASETVNEKDPNNSEFRHDKAVCLLHLAELGKDPAVNLNRSLEILEKLVAESPEHLERQTHLEQAKALQAKLS